MSSDSEKRETLDLTPILSAVFKKWIMIGLLAIAGGALAFVWTHMMKPVYEAQGTLIVVNPTMAGVPPVSSIARGGPTPLSILAGMLASHDAKQSISSRAGITLEQVEAGLVVTNEPSNNQLIIRASGPTRERAKELVGHCFGALDEISNRIANSASTRQIDLIDKSIREKEKDLRDASLAMTEYLAKMQVPMSQEDLTSSTAPFRRLRELEFELKSTQERLATIRQGARSSAEMGLDLTTSLPSSEVWRGRLVDLEYQLAMILQELGEEAPKVQLLKLQIEATKREGLKDISDNLQAIEKGIAPRVVELVAQEQVLKGQIATMREIVGKAPEEVVRIAELSLAVKTATEAVSTLRARLETRQVEVQLEQVRWSVLEEPFSTEPPTNKRPVRNAAVGVFVGFVLAVLLAISPVLLGTRTSNHRTPSAMA